MMLTKLVNGETVELSAQEEAEILAEWAKPSKHFVPQVVTRFQARAALHLNGILDEVEALMLAPDTDALARIAWQDAQEFYRTSSTVLAMAAVLNLNDDDLDNLFIVAAGITA